MANKIYCRAKNDFLDKLLINISKTNQNILSTIISLIIFTKDNEFFLSKDIINNIIEILDSLNKDSSSTYAYHTSKICSKLAKYGIINIIRSKKKIKDSGFLKDYKSQTEEGGFPSLLIRSSTVNDYKQILKNSKAIEKINKLLKEHIELDKFYTLFFNSFMNMLINNPLEFKQTLELTNKSIGSPADGTLADFSNWDIIVSSAKKLSEEERNGLSREFINHMHHTPNNLVLVCFIIFLTL